MNRRSLPEPDTMACCCDFNAAVDAQFTQKKAAEELRKYQTRGPGVTTKFLRDGVAAVGVNGQTLLDIGAGIGALTFELLDKGLTNATAVDASAAYLAAAAQEAARRGRSQATLWVRGDFVELAATIPIADVVTLDRVVCCYPDYKPLLDKSLRHATQTFAFSYPRDRWFVRWAVSLENSVRRLRSNPFRTVVHAVAEMQQMIREAQFELVTRSQTATWAAEIYTRKAPPNKAT